MASARVPPPRSVRCSPSYRDPAPAIPRGANFRRHRSPRDRPVGQAAGFCVYYERRYAPANSRCPLSRDQFIWGLSNGTVFLAVAAAFWLALAASAFGGGFLLVSLVPILIGSGSLVIWSGRLRRKARGVGRQALRNAPKGSSIRRIGT